MNNKDEKTLIEFGNHVRKFRKSQGLSQEELADIAKLHRTYIGMIERGEKNVTLLNIIKIAYALKVTPNELMEFKR